MMYETTLSLLKHSLNKNTIIDALFTRFMEEMSDYVGS